MIVQGSGTDLPMSHDFRRSFYTIAMLTSTLNVMCSFIFFFFFFSFFFSFFLSFFCNTNTSSTPKFFFLFAIHLSLYTSEYRPHIVPLVHHCSIICLPHSQRHSIYVFYVNHKSYFLGILLLTIPLYIRTGAQNKIPIMNGLV